MMKMGKILPLAIIYLQNIIIFELKGDLCIHVYRLETSYILSQQN